MFRMKHIKVWDDEFTEEEGVEGAVGDVGGVGGGFCGIEVIRDASETSVFPPATTAFFCFFEIF